MDEADTYQIDGYYLIKKMVPPDLVIDVNRKLLGEINDYAEKLNVSLEKYLKATSRWEDKASVTKFARDKLCKTIEDKLVRFLNTEVILIESSIISKNKFSNGSIPWHQDISYAVNNPYDFSVWLPFSNIEQDSGGLAIIPRTHKQETKPAIDFWSPDFVDIMGASEYCQQNKLYPQLILGDAVIFNSNLWHGSEPMVKLKDRYVFVSRWKMLKPHDDSYNIPKPENKEFGLWTCHDFTKNVLSSISPLLEKFSFIELLTFWSNLLDSKQLENILDIVKAKEALEMVNILHLSKTCHDGGDVYGQIYKNLYTALLYPLMCATNKTFANIDIDNLFLRHTKDCT